MNRREAAKLELSELEYFDDLNQEYKTYSYQDKEYKLYGSLEQSRLTNESQDEYKVRRLFMKEVFTVKGRMIWNSKNQDSINWWRLAIGSEKMKANTQQMELIKDNVAKTNLGTLDYKKINKFVEEFKREENEK